MLIQLTQGRQVDKHPSWSPDGSRIVYTSRRSVYEQLFIMDIETLLAEQLTHIQGHARNPSWHPDGRQILFDAEFGGRREMYILPGPQYQAKILFQRDIEAHSGMLNANANLLVFIGKGPYERHWNVYTYDFTYNNLNKITRHNNHCHFPRWSPKADYISYHQLRQSNTSKPGILHWYGKPAFTTSFKGIPAFDLSWSPDGYKIVYVVKENDWHHIYKSRRDGSEKVLLYSSGQKLSQPAWSPSGDSIVFCMASVDGTQHLWLLRLY